MTKRIPALPIDDVRDDVLAALTEPRPLVVAAPTGSGKSTRLPLWMLDIAEDAEVLVVEPRRVACRSLAGYLARLDGSRLGERIGYRVRFEDKSSAATRLLFVTPGVALRMLHDGLDATHVVLDEFHERGWETDLLLALLREQLSDEARLIITSATLDVEHLTRHLGATLIESEGRSFPVEIRHTTSPDSPTRRDLEERVAAALRDLVRRGELDGDVLVFLPGKGEIRRTEEALQGIARSEELELIPVHGSLPVEQMARAFESTSARRRVFLATNVAETSITLPGVTTVIDSGLARVMLHRAGRNALALTPISEASMTQRAGRAGRVQAGRCVRLFSERHRSPERSAPELLRIELDEVIVRAANAGLPPGQFQDARWLDPPPEFAVERALERLHGMRVVDDGQLSERGAEIASMPIDIQAARVLLDPPTHLASALADLVALLQVGRDLFLPVHDRRDRDAIHDARKRLLDGVRDEVYAQLTALRHGDPRRHGLHRARLAEARKHATRLRGLVGAPRRSEAPLPEREALAGHLLSRWPESGFVLRPRAIGRSKRRRSKGSKASPWANDHGDEIQVYPWSPPHPVDPGEERETPRAGVLLDHTWIGGQGRAVRGVGRMLLPCRLETLAEAGLGTLEIADATLDSGRVVAREVRTLAEVELDARHRALKGSALHRAAASLILQGRLLKGAAEVVLDALHRVKLLRDWPDPEWTWTGEPETLPDPDDPEGYIARSLAHLGLERSQDFALLEPADLEPDWSTWIWAFPGTLERLDEDFPRVWTYQGAEYLCEVQPRSRSVTLRPRNKAARRGDDPDARFVPRFRGFSVRYVKASRKVVVRP